MIFRFFWSPLRRSRLAPVAVESLAAPTQQAPVSDEPQLSSTKHKFRKMPRTGKT